MPTRKPTRADLVIAFIEQLTITTGAHAGRPFKLRDWQKRFIRDVYVTGKNGKRLVRRAVLSMARKNGKTELAAALVLVHLIGPEAELNGQIIAAANSRDQASLVYDAAKRMVEIEPALQKHLTIVNSRKRIFVRSSGIKAQGSIFYAVAADAGNLHGLNPSMCIYDELAQSKNRDLLTALTTSQGARAEPLFLTISTQTDDPSHPLSEMIDDGLSGSDPTTVCHLYAADDNCDLLDPAGWLKANPALGDFRSRDELEVMANEAQRLPSREHDFRLYYLNQRVAQHASLITAPDWKACVGDAALVPGEAIYLALDMADAGLDLAALVAVSAENGSRAQPWFWKAQDNVIDHAKRDRVPYDVFAKQGNLLTTPGRAIDPDFIAHFIAQLCSTYQVIGLAYDRYHIDQILRYFDKIGFDVQEGPGYGLRVEKWGQGYVDMAPAVNAFERAVILGDLKHDGNPLLTWCVMNAMVQPDPAGNRKLDKSKSRFRIDGAVALAMALGFKARERSAETFVSPWEDASFKIKVA